MEIKNNKLVQAAFKKTPNTSRIIKDHKFIVIHDDVGASMEGTESWILNPSSKVSYHILIGREGQLTQFVEFNKRAWHAGVSKWKGYSNLNDWSVGICFQNKGNQVYTDKQIKLGIEICRELIKVYGYEDITKHKDIAPNRKTDPNNHFPWEYFKKEVLGKIDSKVKVKFTTPDGLNLRTNSNTSSSIIRVLPKNTEVNILSEIDGWSEVFICSTKEKGWVSSSYLK